MRGHAFPTIWVSCWMASRRICWRTSTGRLVSVVIVVNHVAERWRVGCAGVQLRRRRLWVQHLVMNHSRAYSSMGVSFARQSHVIRQQV